MSNAKYDIAQVCLLIFLSDRTELLQQQKYTDKIAPVQTEL